MLYLSRKKRNVVIIELKHTFKDEKEYCHYPYYIACVQKCAIATKRR